ncbi:hypothetical protein ACFRNJ_12095 [Streptomyces sp. NPDC056721]|uniref:hypothetical protein n=1 Tax=Streptomyces sp. NPDC056721 TaxID=3345923 RepID=UPI00367B9397
MVTTRIHINQHHIRANRKADTAPDERLPVITAKDYKQNRKGNDVAILDEAGRVVARVVYRPDQPLDCGAHVWIETTHEVVVR